MGVISPEKKIEHAFSGVQVLTGCDCPAPTLEIIVLNMQRLKAVLKHLTQNECTTKALCTVQCMSVKKLMTMHMKIYL